MVVVRWRRCFCFIVVCVVEVFVACDELVLIAFVVICGNTVWPLPLVVAAGAIYSTVAVMGRLL